MYRYVEEVVKEYVYISGRIRASRKDFSRRDVRWLVKVIATEIEISVAEHITGIALIKGVSRAAFLFHVKREEMKIEAL